MSTDLAAAAQYDPLAQFMRPPLDETPAQMMARRKRELDAERVSEKIEEQLKRDRIQWKKEKEVVKVLLLGQAESGKSTTLKNFRMRYAPLEWEKERDGWRVIVQLNVVRSITFILRVLEAELNGDPLEEDVQLEGEDTGLAVDPTCDFTHICLTEWHHLLMIRLAPLRSVETELKKRLGGEDDSQPLHCPLSASPFDSQSAASTRRLREVFVRSWQDIVDPGAQKMRRATHLPPELDTITATIAACREDMISLWKDKAVQLALQRRQIRLPDSAGFFLNDLDRIAKHGYAVSDNDVVRARMRTAGVQEYHIKFDRGWDSPGFGASWEWRIYDVGGCRTLRSAWLPYFENVNVIIFLAPVSAFDERLSEDRRVNRLQDSIELWTSICSSKLLAKTQLILFLNKCDLLHRKLKRGIKLNKFVKAYGDRPNDVTSVITCQARALNLRWAV
ncbi:hypothetical protein APHAL10511_003009 [Amanita phalloides]|nr:hypothetical protein APHAL10511_003009 [Amanita phalloides]